MPLLRKTLKATAITLAVLTIVCSLLWYKLGDNISPDMWRHAENVLHGGAAIGGGRTPGELIRYAKQRLLGHPNIEAIVLPPLHWLQAKYERPVPPSLPTLGKGQQPKSLSPPVDQVNTKVTFIQTSEDLAAAVSKAKAGDTLLMLPGNYGIGKTLKTAFAGSKGQPITLRADQPGTVIIEVGNVVGFKVAHAYWTFENLTLRGTCNLMRYCEHAFQIFGDAQNITLRNNLIENFNAHIKVNGFRGLWPDNGLVQYNTITNSTSRETKTPVTPIDLVGADHWKVQDNIISNFIKGGGNRISYGVFMKGGSHYGRIERNLIICTTSAISQYGVRVGISFGGGTTGPQYCRDKACEVEHTAGLAANNIVAHCNDAGIDVNRSKNITIAHNTIINAAGIDVRGKLSQVRIYGNILDGAIRQRGDVKIQSDMNEVKFASNFYANADELNLTWSKYPDNIPSLLFVPTDFCETRRANGTPPGAVIATPGCTTKY